MKKRILALVCALVLVMGMTTTAFAKPSQEGGRIRIYDALGELVKIIKIEEEKFQDVLECTHGEGCDGAVEIITPVLSKYRELVDAFKIEDLIKGTKFEGKDWIKIFEMEVVAKDCVKFPITVEFDKEDWVEGKPIIAHYNTTTKAWELVELDEEADCFTTKFDSLSPFVFYVEKGGAGVDSPTTGDPMSVGVAMMAIGAAGLAVVSRKRK